MDGSPHQSIEPRQNIELKARYADLAHARGVCRRIGASFAGVLNQTDTYFRTDDGTRSKLREINGERAELITYARPNENSIRTSEYAIEPIANPDQIESYRCLNYNSNRLQEQTRAGMNLGV